MEPWKEKIKEIIKNKQLSFEEINLWNKVIENLKENSYQEILWFIENDPRGLEILTDNIKAKYEAIKKGDLTEWEEILKKDTKLLNN